MAIIGDEDSDNSQGTCPFYLEEYTLLVVQNDDFQSFNSIHVTEKVEDAAKPIHFL